MLWIITVYLPMVGFGGGLLLVALSFSHVAVNPHLLADALLDAVLVTPKYGWAAFKSLAAAAYHRVFRNAPPKTSAPAQIAYTADVEPPEDSQLWLGFMMLAVFGWWLSACPPSLPAHSG